MQTYPKSGSREYFNSAKVLLYPISIFQFLHSKRLFSMHSKPADVHSHMGLFVGLTDFSYYSCTCAPLRVGTYGSCLLLTKAFRASGLCT